MSRIECIDVGAWLGLGRDLPECVGFAQCVGSIFDRCTCGLRRVRVWTMPAAAICRREGLRLSTDTAGFELQAVNGRQWEAANIGDRSGRRRGGPYRHAYGPAQKWNSPVETPPGYYNPCELLDLNLRNFNAWAISIPDPTEGPFADLVDVAVFDLEGGVVRGHVLRVPRLWGLEEILAWATAPGWVTEVQVEAGCYVRVAGVPDFAFLAWEELEGGADFERPPGVLELEEASDGVDIYLNTI